MSMSQTDIEAKRESEMARGYDEVSIKRRTCQECGMLLDDAGEYHPYVFCVLKKAGLDPWQEFRLIALQLQLGDPGDRPPLIREMYQRGGIPTALPSPESAPDSGSLARVPNPEGS